MYQVVYMHYIAKSFIFSQAVVTYFSLIIEQRPYCLAFGWFSCCYKRKYPSPYAEKSCISFYPVFYFYMVCRKDDKRDRLCSENDRLLGRNRCKSRGAMEDLHLECKIRGGFALIEIPCTNWVCLRRLKTVCSDNTLTKR